MVPCDRAMRKCLKNRVCVCVSVHVCVRAYVCMNDRESRYARKVCLNPKYTGLVQASVKLKEKEGIAVIDL